MAGLESPRISPFTDFEAPVFQAFLCLEGGLGSRPSYAWRSIFWGRELLEKGMIKSVGNGTSIKVWSDNWILDELPRPAIQPEDMEDEDLTVADLLYPNSSMWNIPMLRHYFTERDVNHITQIRLSLNREDQFSWHYSTNGEYSTKTGYKLSDLLVETSDHQNNPVRTVEQKQWSHIWKLKTSPKIRHFFWRASKGALGVAERLRS